MIRVLGGAIWMSESRFGEEDEAFEEALFWIAISVEARELGFLVHIDLGFIFAMKGDFLGL